MPEITQDNLYLLLPNKVANIAMRLAVGERIAAKKALLKLYHSPLYRQLEKEETKLWHYSPAQLFAIGFRPSEDRPSPEPSRRNE